MALAATLASCRAARPAAPIAPTATLAPTAAPSTPSTPARVDVEVERQADGTSVVSDLSNAYEFTLGQEWMVIPVTRERIDRVAQASPAPDAEFLRLAQKLDAKRLDAFRLVGMNMDSRFAKADHPTLILVTAIPDRISAALPMPKLAQMIEETVFTDANVVERNVVHNANGLNVAVVEGPYDYLSTEGATLKSRSKVLGLQANSRVILIQFITPVEYGSDVLPDTDSVIDSLRRIKP